MRFYKTIFIDAVQDPNGIWTIDGKFFMSNEQFQKEFIPVKDSEFEIPQLEAGRFLMPIKYKEDK